MDTRLARCFRNTALVARVSLLALAAFVALSAGTARADRELVIMPGQEGRVLDLFRPVALGEELAPGVRLMNVQITPREIRVSLETDATPEPVWVRLTAPEDDSGTELTRTAHFRLAPGSEDATVPAEVRPGVDALAARVRANESPDFWSQVRETTPDDPEGGSSGGWSRRTTTRVVVLVALLLVVVGPLVWSRARSRREE